MSNLTETSTWEDGIYCLAVTDKLLGGENGVSNKQAIQLANRTLWLKDQLTETQEAITPEAISTSDLESVLI